MNTESLARVIDVHAHAGPDSIRREIDALDLARMAKSRGMRGIVLKNHYESTASLAYVVRKEVPGIEVFGGITLNLTTGGMNAAAVEHMAMVTGGWGRFVWMGSFDCENQVRYEKGDRPFVSISCSGELRSEVREVIGAISRHRLVLATGHSTPDEVLMLIREARLQGVSQVVVTHAMMAPIHMSFERMREAASLGAYIEFAYNGLIGPYKEFEFGEYAQAIRALGAAHCVLVSDLGQAENPLHPDGLMAFFAGLRREGLSEPEIDCMSKENPARLLRLD